MAKRRPSRQVAATSPLTGTVTTIGPLPKITVGQRAATVADLEVAVTGGVHGRRVSVTFTVTLKVKLAATGTATLIDESGSLRAVQAIKAGSSYIFENAQFPAPVSAARVFRITNVRANANGLAGGVAGSVPVVATVSISASTPTRLTGAQQSVATIVNA